MVKNIDSKFRKSEEYRVWMEFIKLEHGDRFNEYLAEIAIALHLNNPCLYKEY